MMLPRSNLNKDIKKDAESVMFFFAVALGIVACGGGGSTGDSNGGMMGDDSSALINVSVLTTHGGVASAENVSVQLGGVAVVEFTADPGFELDNVDGCSGNLTNTNFTTEPLISDCTLIANFSREGYEIKIDRFGEGMVSDGTTECPDVDVCYLPQVADTMVTLNAIASRGPPAAALFT